MKAKNLKRSFLLSVLSLVLCVSMFVGTTFAWFTDSITNTKNKIMAGNLDVELYFQVEGQTDWTKVTEDTNIFMEGALWEPGHTEVIKLKVVNEGSLALKYQLGVNIAEETGSVNQLGKEFKLSDFIKYGVMDNGVDFASRDEAVLAVDSSAKTISELPYTSAGELAAATESISTMVVYMPTTVGNDANAAKDEAVPTIYLGLNLYATQVANEEDSFGNDYDKDIAMVGTEADLRAAFAQGVEKVILTADIEADADTTMTLLAGETVNLDLNGHTIAGVSDATGSNRNLFDIRGTLNVINGTLSVAHVGVNMGWSNSTNVFNVTAGGVLNLENVVVENLGGSDMAFGVHLNNWGEVTLNANNCTFYSTYGCIRAFNSGYDMNNVTITNSMLQSPNMVFWVHNYTAADFGNDAAKADAAAARLNFNFIIDNPVDGVAIDDASNLVAEANNTFVGKIRYGFTNGEVYYQSSATVAKAVTSAADLQAKLDAATGTESFFFARDIVGDVMATQKPDVAITVDGNNKTFTGVFTVNGQSKRYDTAALTIKNVNFKAETLSADSFIRLGYNNDTRYTNHVTVQNCTFSGAGETFVAVKSLTGGDYNLTLDNLTINEGMHSLAQLKNVEQNLVVTNCKVYSKNGLNVNNGDNLTMNGCTFDVKGYAVRFGSDANDYARTFDITDSTLKSACAESGDAVIEFRKGAAAHSTLNLVNTTVEGTVKVAGNVAGTVINGLN